MAAVLLEPTPPSAPLVVACAGFGCLGCGAELACQQTAPQTWAWTHQQPVGECRELLVPLEPVLYLVHLHPAYRHARHYLGIAEDLPGRLADHAAGRGANLLAVTRAAGCTFELTRLWWPASRRHERELKQRKYAPRLCPRCTPTPIRHRFTHEALGLFGSDHNVR